MGTPIFKLFGALFATAAVEPPLLDSVMALLDLECVSRTGTFIQFYVSNCDV